MAIVLPTSSLATYRSCCCDDVPDMLLHSTSRTSYCPLSVVMDFGACMLRIETWVLCLGFALATGMVCPPKIQRLGIFWRQEGLRELNKSMMRGRKTLWMSTSHVSVFFGLSNRMPSFSPSSAFPTQQ